MIIDIYSRWKMPETTMLWLLVTGFVDTGLKVLPFFVWFILYHAFVTCELKEAHWKWINDLGPCQRRG
jgi:hypothetical protein